MRKRTGFNAVGPSGFGGIGTTSSVLSRGRGPRGPPAWAAAGATTLSDGARTTLRTVGFILVAAGVILLGLAIANMTAAADEPFTVGPGGRTGGPSFAAIALPGFLGAACLGAGTLCLKLGFLGALSGVVATEAAPATQVAATAAAEGFGTGLKQSGFTMAGAPTVKVRCRACGGLDSEDARFCSGCGKPM